MNDLVEVELRELISEIKGGLELEDLAGDMNLLASSTIDSIDFLELLSACEKKFSVTIDLFSANLGDISSIDGLVRAIRTQREREAR